MRGSDGDLADGDRPTVRDLGPRRRHQHERVVEHPPVLEARLGRDLGEGDVQLAVGHRVEQLVHVVGLAQHDVDPGPPLVEARQQPAAARGCRRSGRCRRRMVPRSPAAMAATSAWAAPSRRSTPRACSTIVRPASVSSTGRGPPGRSNSGVPTMRSSAAICWLTADWVYPSRAAARRERALVGDGQQRLEVAQLEGRPRAARAVRRGREGRRAHRQSISPSDETSRDCQFS